MFSSELIGATFSAEHPLRQVKEMAHRAAAPMQPFFVAMAAGGSAGAPSQRELLSVVLMALYDIRSETIFCEELRANPMFRWFVGLAAGEEGLAEGPFAQMRNRLLHNRAAGEFFARMTREMSAAGLLADAHFHPDARQIAVWSGPS